MVAQEMTAVTVVTAKRTYPLSLTKGISYEPALPALWFDIAVTMKEAIRCESGTA